MEMYTYKYPHPAVTTDSVVFGFDGRALNLLLIERGIEPFKGSWALPGGFVRIDETVEEGARRELWEETGVKDVYLEQFHVFSDVNRDPRERVITVAFVALVSKSEYQLIAGDDAVRALWFDVDELPPLAFDHDDIIRMAREKLKEMLRLRPIAFNLLDRHFSMPELQKIYELINNTTYDRRNFAKKINASGYIHRVDEEPPAPSACRASRAPRPRTEASFKGAIQGIVCHFLAPSESDYDACKSYDFSPSAEPESDDSRPRKGNVYSFDSESFEQDIESNPDQNRRNPFDL